MRKLRGWNTILALLALGSATLCENASAAQVAWDAGGGNQSWGTATNWSGNVVPFSTDSVLFNDTGSSNVPGTPTSVLDTSRSIANLSFANTNGHFQTIDLGTNALQVNGNVDVNTNVVDTTLATIEHGTLNLGTAASPINLSVGRVTLNTNTPAFVTFDLTGATVNGNVQNLIVGEKILGGNGYAVGTLNLGAKGALTVGSVANPGEILIGHTANSNGSTGTVDLSQQATFTATVSNLLVGTSEVGTATGTLDLAGSNVINSTTVRVGYSTATDNQATTSALHLGTANTITASELTVGGNLSTGTLDIPSGGSLVLGSSAQPTNLNVGQSSSLTNQSPQGLMTLSDAAFNATLSELSVGVKGGGGAGTQTGVLLGGSSGVVSVGSPAEPGTIIVGQVTGGGTAAGTVDLSGETSLTANVSNLLVGSAAVGNSTGVLSLPASNTIAATTIRVGYSTATDNQATTSALHLGTANTITASELTVGGNLSTGTLDIPSGGSLVLGSSAQPTNLNVGQSSSLTNQSPQGLMTLSDAAFNATLSELSVGVKGGGGAGTQTGVLLGGSSGVVSVGSPAEPGTIIVGQVTGGGTAAGTVDLSGETSLTANVSNLLVGSAAVGNSTGVLSLPASNTIAATTIRVGYSTATDNQATTSALHLGTANTITASELTVGGNLSTGTLDIPSGGSLVLGSSAQPTNLNVGQSSSLTNQSPQGLMTLSDAAFNATLSELSVGVKGGGGAGTQTGVLLGGNAGNITIGSPSALGSIIVGQSSGGGNAVGTVDLSGQTSLTANVNQVVIGNSGTGTLLLPATNSIDAKSILVGANGNATLQLGTQNSLLADSIQVGNSYSNASVQTHSGTTNLGAPNRLADLSIGNAVINTNSTYSATVDFSGSTFNAHLNNLTVGQRDISTPGNQVAKFIGGSSGTISVGTPGNTANMLVGSGANATMDMSSMNSFSANVNQMTLAVNGGATVALAASNSIDAKTLIVGSGGSGVLTLGMNNTVLADDLELGLNYGTGLIKIPSGAVLNLGSVARPTNLVLGNGVTNTTSTYSGTLDLSNATVHAQLGNVLIGQKDLAPGRQQGFLTISNHADNTIVANSIVMGNGNADGTINFGGGDFSVNSITKGTGTATFNWSGGTLHVGTFGAPAMHMDLINNSTGTLSPANSAGTIAGATTLFGNYMQQSAATTQIDLGGLQAGSTYDLITISNVATLGGTFDVHLINGFQPTLNESFTPLVFASHVGDFANYNGLDVGGHLTLQHTLNANNLMLTARPTINGDISLDGIVNGLDVNAVASNWLTHNARGDVNGDGIVNGLDINVIAANWLSGGGTGAGGTNPAVVPEPSSLFLAALGVLALTVRQKQLHKS